MTTETRTLNGARRVWRVGLWMGVAAALVVPTAQAIELNGFMPAPGEGTVALSYTAESYDEFWVGDMRVSEPALGEVSTYSTTAWFTWGLARNLALVGNLAYVDTSGDGFMNFEQNDFQDLTALLEYRFASFDTASARHSFLVAGGVRTPLGDYEANLPVSIGDGTTDVLTRLVYHFERGPFYLSQQLGFDSRGGDAPDGFPLYTELGYTHHRLTYTAFYVRYQADGGTDIGDPGFTFPSNGDEFERVGGKLYARLSSGFGLSFLTFTTLDGRNSGDTTGFSVGGSYSF